MARMKPRKAPPSLMKNLLARTVNPPSALSPEVDDEVASIVSNEAQITSDVSSKSPSEANVSVKPGGLNAAIDLACKISDTLIFFGWAQDQDDPIKSVHLGGQEKDFISKLHRYERPEINVKLGVDSDDHQLGFLLLVDAPKSTQGGTITLENGAGTKVLSYQLSQELKANPTFNSYFGEMLSVAESQGYDGLYSLLSKYAVPGQKETAIRAAFDYCYWLPGGVLFSSGWVFSGTADIVSMQTTIGGTKYDLYAAPTLIAREDLKHGFTEIGNKAKTAGFISCIQTSAEDGPTKISVKVTASNKDTLIVEVAPKKLDDRQEFSRIALSYLDISKDGFKKMLDEHMGEALQMGLAYPDKSQFLLKQQRFGTLPTNPKVSVIVPLYGRIDFLKYQLSQFADDPDFKKDIELIYVLDDPKHENLFFRYCADQAPIFQVPFKAITYGMNLGYAGANNVAAGLATAKHLLLLNSDVLPDSKGWVSKLLSEYTALKNAGAIAPKLLYEDGSIQHAGMVFERFAAIDGMWSNAHPGKGMPDTEPVKPQPIEVPAVTAACLLISKALYEQVGGLDEQYFL
ncbi:MAG TPA: glycosyltransferase, partial [Methylophilaceae bacterium]